MRELSSAQRFSLGVQYTITRTKMKNTIGIIVGFFVGIGAAQAAVVMDVSDVLFVAGEGANRATLIIDFNDGNGTESFAWGYRWDGVASGEDMLTTIALADPNLTIDSASFVGSVSYFDGATLHSAASDFATNFESWGYYLSGGFAGDDQPFVAGGIPLAVSGGGSALPSSWTISPTGASLVSFGDSGRILEDGSWDAWSFGSYDSVTFDHLAAPGPEAPEAAAIPEPSVFSVLLIGAASLAVRRRR